MFGGLGIRVCGLLWLRHGTRGTGQAALLRGQHVVYECDIM